MITLDNNKSYDNKFQSQVISDDNSNTTLLEFNKEATQVDVSMPWNSYWRTFEVSLKYLSSHIELNTNQKEFQLLNFANGFRDNTDRFLHAGYTVTKFDIFKKNKITDTEKLPFNDESFEVVVGIDILNYVDINKSIIEIRRVLKKNGIAIFRVPVKLPLIDLIRHSKFMNLFFRLNSSPRSRDYRAKYQLNAYDLKLIRAVFPNMTIERSNILSRLDYYLNELEGENISVFEKWDHFLSRFIPGYNLLGGAAILILKNAPEC